MKKLFLILIALGLFLQGCGNDLRGIQGPAGVAGPTGATGAAASCSVAAVNPGPGAPNGGALIDCSDGSQAIVVNGTDGTNGANGIDGTNGTNGTTVSVVQLCPKQGAASYGNWPEVGFCINNVLYALFEDNKGNLENTALSSGSYEDSANNQTCNLTVSGCAVTQN